MDAVERIRITVWEELPLIGVLRRDADESEMIGVSPEWAAALRSALCDAGIAPTSRISRFVLDAAPDEGSDDPDGPVRFTLVIPVPGEPERRVELESTARTRDAIRHAHLGKPHPDILQFNQYVPAVPLLRCLRDREQRALRRRETLHDPEYRANVQATALAVAFALLGLALALHPLLRAN